MLKARPIIEHITQPIIVRGVATPDTGGGDLRFAFTFGGQAFTFNGQSFTYGAS